MTASLRSWAFSVKIEADLRLLHSRALISARWRLSGSVDRVVAVTLSNLCPMALMYGRLKVCLTMLCVLLV